MLVVIVFARWPTMQYWMTLVLSNLWPIRFCTCHSDLPQDILIAEAHWYIFIWNNHSGSAFGNVNLTDKLWLTMEPYKMVRDLKIIIRWAFTNCNPQFVSKIVPLCPWPHIPVRLIWSAWQARCAVSWVLDLARHGHATGHVPCFQDMT